MNELSRNTRRDANGSLPDAIAPDAQNSAPMPDAPDSRANADAELWGISYTYWQGQEQSASKPDAGAESDDIFAAASSLTEEAASSADDSAHDSPENADAAKEDGDGEKSMGLLDHLNELRQRLTRCIIAAAIGFGICWGFVDQLFDIILRPLLTVLPAGTHAQYTTLPEAFFTRMEIAFVAGLFIASPAIFYQIWAFVAPGLYDEEKKYILPIAFLSAIFFITGGLFCYFIVFPFAFNFFISYSTPDVVMTPKISDYLSFVLKLVFAFGLIFEMPIFTLFLSRLGIITATAMRRARKYAIVVIFILAAILTPPDVISQLLMACPMLLLYELSIGVAAIFGRKPQSKEK